MDAQELLKDVGDVEKTIEKRTDKIINWIKKPHNLIFTLIIAFALIIRLYYFLMTQNQPLWWDGAEYMSMARAWALGLEYEFLVVRPAFFPFIMSLFLRLAYNEFLPRLFLLIISMASVFGIYYFTKELYNKKAALVATFLMSVFYLNIFYSFRLLVEVPSLAFYTFSAFFLYKYIKDGSVKSLYWAAVMVAIGTLFKLPTATILFSLLIYLLITERLRFIKKKELWIAALIFALILSPYLIWGYFEFGGFVITQAGGWNAPAEGEYFSNGYTNLKAYIHMFPTLLSWPLLIFFILGLFSLYKIFIGVDMLIKGKDFKLKKDLFLILLIIITILVVSFSVAFNEDRYIINIFPVVFAMAGAFIISLYEIIRKKGKFIAVLFLIVLLGTVGYLQLQDADNLIKLKKDSYLQVKQAGLWIKENSQPEDVIVTKSWPHIQFYGEITALRLPNTKEEFEELVASNPNITLLMISIYEPHQDWAYTYPQENNLNPLKIYFVDAQNSQPSLIIYRFDRSDYSSIISSEPPLLSEEDQNQNLF